MNLTLDWPTIILLIVVNGVVDCVGVAYLAGRQSKKKLVRYLESEESKPLIEKITQAVAAQVKVPTVPEIIEAMPDPPDLTDKLNLLEERMGAKLTASMDAKWGALQEQLSTRVGQVVQANIASAKASFAAANRELSDMGEDNDGSMLTEVLGIFMDEDSIKKVSRAKHLFKRFQANGGLWRGGAGGGQAPQGGYPFGTIMNGYVSTPQGWKPLQGTPPPALTGPPAPAPSAPAAAPVAADLPPELPPEPKKA